MCIYTVQHVTGQDKTKNSHVWLRLLCLSKIKIVQFMYKNYKEIDMRVIKM
jgi:hypothetical protein